VRWASRCARPGPSSSSSRHLAGATDFAAIAEGHWRVYASPPTFSAPVPGLPEGDPAVCRHHRGHGKPRRPDPWTYYTSVVRRRPQAVQHTKTMTLNRRRLGTRPRPHMGPDDVGSIAFPFAHIAVPTDLVSHAVMGFRPSWWRPLGTVRAAPLRRHGATMVGASTAFYVAYSTAQQQEDAR